MEMARPPFLPHPRLDRSPNQRHVWTNARNHAISQTFSASNWAGISAARCVACPRLDRHRRAFESVLTIGSVTTSACSACPSRRPAPSVTMKESFRYRRIAPAIGAHKCTNDLMRSAKSCRCRSRRGRDDTAPPLPSPARFSALQHRFSTRWAAVCPPFTFANSRRGILIHRFLRTYETSVVSMHTHIRSRSLRTWPICSTSVHTKLCPLLLQHL